MVGIQCGCGLTLGFGYCEPIIYEQVLQAPPACMRACTAPSRTQRISSTNPLSKALHPRIFRLIFAISYWRRFKALLLGTLRPGEPC
jgi:hypothetical protein